MKIEPEVYIIIPIHALGLLKEEIQYFYPKWRFHWGEGGFVLFRTEKDFDLKKLQKLPITFSLCRGKLLLTGKKSEVKKEVKSALKKYDAHCVHYWDLIDETGEMGDRKTRGNVIDLIRYGNDMYALGVRFQVRGDFAPFNGASPIPKAKNSPSKGYYKVAEAFKHFRPLVGHDEVFLDVGCSPGGSSYFLLKKGYRVIGVDPKPLDKIVYKDFPEGVIQLNQPFSKLKAKSLKGLPPVSWILFDVDLPPLEALPKILKLMNKLEDCVGLIMMVKCGKTFSPSQFKELDKVILDYGPFELKKSVLPSLDKEFCLILSRTD